MTTGVVVLAAGMGTRMRSSLAKVLHPVCGTPMVGHVVAAAREIDPAALAVVIGHQGQAVREALGSDHITFVAQPDLLGTADAVSRAHQALAGVDTVVVTNGDTPLITGPLLQRLAMAVEGGASMAFATVEVADAARLGRVRRDGAGHVAAIVEAADDDGPSHNREVNAGQYAFSGAWLWGALTRIRRSASGEYYLTHLAALAAAEGRPPATVRTTREEALGVDDRVRLAEANAVMRRRILERHMLAGVTIEDPATTYVDAAVTIAQDATIRPNCYLYGTSTVGEGSVVGPGSLLRNSTVGAGCEVLSSVVEDSRVGNRVHLGPFAHVRGNSTIGDNCTLGNYAEVNRSTLGRDVKMHHFSYLGDADVGNGANIAAGVITNNYDGVAKHRTVIGDGAFIGCDTMLVAPLSIGAGAQTGSGSVVTRDVAPGELVYGVPARPHERRARD